MFDAAFLRRRMMEMIWHLSGLFCMKGRKKQQSGVQKEKKVVGILINRSAQAESAGANRSHVFFLVLPCFSYCPSRSYLVE
jgi:hypothetical protein